MAILSYYVAVVNLSMLLPSAPSSARSQRGWIDKPARIIFSCSSDLLLNENIWSNKYKYIGNGNWLSRDEWPKKKRIPEDEIVNFYNSLLYSFNFYPHKGFSSAFWEACPFQFEILSAVQMSWNSKRIICQFSKNWQQTKIESPTSHTKVGSWLLPSWQSWYDV